MHVIYHCPQHSYSAAVAAAIHLELLPPDRKPSPRTILEIVDYFAWPGAERGSIYPAGADGEGNRVYLLPRSFSLTILQNVVTGFTRILGGDVGELSLVDASLPGRHWHRANRLFSSLAWLTGSRFLPVLEINNIYFALVKLVEGQRRQQHFRGKGKWF